MINAFCRSHFSYNEKRNLFFSQHPRTCRHCHLPKIKRRLNLNNFTRVHRALICTCALQGGQAAGHGAVGPGAGGAGAGGARHGGAGQLLDLELAPGPAAPPCPAPPLDLELVDLELVELDMVDMVELLRIL